MNSRPVQAVTVRLDLDPCLREGGCRDAGAAGLRRDGRRGKRAKRKLKRARRSKDLHEGGRLGTPRPPCLPPPGRGHPHLFLGLSARHAHPPRGRQPISAQLVDPLPGYPQRSAPGPPGRPPSPRALRGSPGILGARADRADRIAIQVQRLKGLPEIWPNLRPRTKGSPCVRGTRQELSSRLARRSHDGPAPATESRPGRVPPPGHPGHTPPPRVWATVPSDAPHQQPHRGGVSAGPGLGGGVPTPGALAGTPWTGPRASEVRRKSPGSRPRAGHA